ncbi:MAG: hypothetical protein MAG451_01206 [Anaerolineales bacterium]|nr:hypothetical protein [Anaerolineales bacterium]
MALIIVSAIGFRPLSLDCQIQAELVAETMIIPFDPIRDLARRYNTLQETFLFNGTIADNIRYGRLNAGDEAMVEAAKTVGAHEELLARGGAYFKLYTLQWREREVEPSRLKVEG